MRAPPRAESASAASSRARRAAMSPNSAVRSVRSMSLSGTALSSSDRSTSPPLWTGISPVSKLRMARMAERPLVMPRQ